MVSSFRNLLVISRWRRAGSDVLQEAITTSVLVLISYEALLSFDGRPQSPPTWEREATIPVLLCTFGDGLTFNLGPFQSDLRRER